MLFKFLQLCLVKLKKKGEKKKKGKKKVSP